MDTIDLPLYHSGKVRNTYLLPGHPDLLLVVASDRLSTHNVTHLSEVPGKGELLTALTVFWHLGPLRGIPNHIVAFGWGIHHYLPLGHWPNDLFYRALVVRRLDMIPIEFVWRYRLAGSLYKAYAKGKDPYGIALPPELKKMSSFGIEDVFTPTEKSETDDPLLESEVREKYPSAVMLTNIVATFMYQHLRSRGIDLIDTKFEVGALPGNPHKFLLADEFGTGDSSRFAYARDIRVGEDPPWLDKQVFREETERLWGGTSGPPLAFSAEVIKRGLERYHDAFKSIAGGTLAEFRAKYFKDELLGAKAGMLGD